MCAGAPGAKFCRSMKVPPVTGAPAPPPELAPPGVMLPPDCTPALLEPEFEEPHDATTNAAASRSAPKRATLVFRMDLPLRVGSELARLLLEPSRDGFVLSTADEPRRERLTALPYPNGCVGSTTLRATVPR